MIAAEIKSILLRLNPFLQNCLESCIGNCVSRGHYEVTIEHILYQSLQNKKGDFDPILKSFHVDEDEMLMALNQELAEMSSGNTAKPVFSATMLQVMELAWVESGLNLNAQQIRSGALLLALSRNVNLLPVRIQPFFHKIQHGMLYDKFHLLTADSIESKMEREQITKAKTPGKSEPGTPGAGFLEKYCVDFYEMAKSGKIDPIFGRDAEIHQVIDILGRRRKNNPIMIGEAGVGKTAVIEGLALKIANGEVPDLLKDAHIVGLDLGMLSAGAGVRGEFENRLKGILKEIKESSENIILFIDEAHTLIGAGGEAGKNDAANLLKPELARGEMKCLAATTFSEYRKYFEKDPAMARRFQAVTVDEPDVETAAVMLRGLKEKYEEFHGVAVTQEAIYAACELSHRFIAGRQLPDKAVDLLDTAIARVKMTQSSKPASIQNMEQDMLNLERELEIYKQDLEKGLQVEEEYGASILKKIETLKLVITEQTAQWEVEQALVKNILRPDGEEMADKTREELMEELQQTQGDTPLVEPFVTSASVARIIEEWTGIPAGNMMRSEAASLATLEDSLNTRVIGQSWGIYEITNTIKSARLSLTRPETPDGVFLITGPSGVGKTEVAKAIADQLYGGSDHVLTLNMSEYQDSISVTQLKGASAGYVGYGEGGVLTEGVRKRPYTVVILDEIEKAHKDVLNMFYQVFDQGILRDGEGRMINFRNTVIIMTSNLGTDTIMDMAMDEEQDYNFQEYTDAVFPELTAHFAPALLARCKPVPFLPLGSDTIQTIVAIKLDKLAARMQDVHGIQLQVDQALLEYVALKCTRGQSGARNIDSIIDEQILPGISTMLLNAIAEDKDLTAIQVSADEDGIVFSGDEDATMEKLETSVSDD